MVLEYALGEPAEVHAAEWEGGSFGVELRSLAAVGGFEFSQPDRRISFDYGGDGAYVTATFDPGLLGRPYTVTHAGERIGFHGHETSDGRTGLSMRPDSPGRVDVVGTTVIGFPAEPSGPAGGGPAPPPPPGDGIQPGLVIALLVALAGIGAVGAFAAARRFRAQ